MALSLLPVDSATLQPWQAGLTRTEMASTDATLKGRLHHCSVPQVLRVTTMYTLSLLGCP
jgi:hypothetical protein